MQDVREDVRCAVVHINLDYPHEVILCGTMLHKVLDDKAFELDVLCFVGGSDPCCHALLA